MPVTNAIESVNMGLRKLTKNRGSFPSDEALTKLFYLALRNISQKWTMPIRDWKAALTRFTIQFGDRFSVNSSPNRLHKIPDMPLTSFLESTPPSEQLRRPRLANSRLLRQLVENSTFTDNVPRLAALLKRSELDFQQVQLLDARGHMAKMCVNQSIHRRAVLGGGVQETQQHPDLVQRHVQGTAMANEQETIQMRLIVDAVVPRRALRLRQEPFALVEADRLDLRTRDFRQLTNLHDNFRGWAENKNFIVGT